MKKCSLTAIMAFLLLICQTGINAQTVTPKLDQHKLMLSFLGKWEANVGKDTVEVWEFRQFGEAFIIDVSQVVKGRKTPMYINNIGYDPKEGRFKGFGLWIDGGYVTWIGSFISPNKFTGNMVRNFNPEAAFIKLENIILKPDEWTWAQYNMNGVKIQEYKFKRIK
jgi:hypothetical protein